MSKASALLELFEHVNWGRLGYPISRLFSEDNDWVSPVFWIFIAVLAAYLLYRYGGPVSRWLKLEVSILNGWQRIWMVAAAGAFLFPYHLWVYHEFELPKYVLEDIASARSCSEFDNIPRSKLHQALYAENRLDDCFKYENVRNVYSNSRGETFTADDLIESSDKFWRPIAAAIYYHALLAARWTAFKIMGSLYVLGLLISWVVKGFSESRRKANYQGENR
jgi:hypothetical protein